MTRTSVTAAKRKVASRRLRSSGNNHAISNQWAGLSGQDLLEALDPDYVSDDPDFVSDESEAELQ